jgi:hypothetical protein
MKNNKIALGTCLLFLAAALIIVSCNKNQTNKVTPQENKTSYDLPANEIKFFPKDKNEAGALAMSFLKQTNFNPSSKKTRDIGPLNYPSQQAAWIFEASSNFLINQNNIVPTGTTTYTIELIKNADGTIDASELASKFNALMATIQGNVTVTAKLANVTISSEQATSMNINIDVNHGTEPANSIVYPSNNMNYDVAATWLSNTFSWQHEGFGLIPGTSYGNCNGLNPFWYNITIVSPLCYYFPTLSDLPDPWLWTADVANGNYQDPVFKAADFPKYYNNMQTKANSYNALAGQGNIPVGSQVINMSLNGYLPTNNTHWLSCQGNVLINGYVHALEGVIMANLGCMPMAN